MVKERQLLDYMQKQKTVTVDGLRREFALTFGEATAFLSRMEREKLLTPSDKNSYVCAVRTLPPVSGQTSGDAVRSRAKSEKLRRELSRSPESLRAAVKACLTAKTISIEYLKRKLKVNYGTSLLLLDWLIRHGVVEKNARGKFVLSLDKSDTLFVLGGFGSSNLSGASATGAENLGNCMSYACRIYKSPHRYDSQKKALAECLRDRLAPVRRSDGKSEPCVYGVIVLAMPQKKDFKESERKIIEELASISGRPTEDMEKLLNGFSFVACDAVTENKAGRACFLLKALSAFPLMLYNDGGEVSACELSGEKQIIRASENLLEYIVGIEPDKTKDNALQAINTVCERFYDAVPSSVKTVIDRVKNYLIAVSEKEYASFRKELRKNVGE